MPTIEVLGGDLRRALGRWTASNAGGEPRPAGLVPCSARAILTAGAAHPVPPRGAPVQLGSPLARNRMPVVAKLVGQLAPVQVRPLLLAELDVGIARPPALGEPYSACGFSAAGRFTGGWRRGGRIRLGDGFGRRRCFLVGEGECWLTACLGARAVLLRRRVRFTSGASESHGRFI